MQFATVQPIIARPDLPVITDEEAAALARTTVNLFRAWGLTDGEARVLLGDMAQRTWARWKVGDSVTALLPGGGYAEFAAVDGRHALPLPKGLDFVQAAALPETVFTVWTNVFERGALRAGETLLVHGANSGIGVTAIQMAKAAGARVIATARADAALVGHVAAPLWFHLRRVSGAAGVPAGRVRMHSRPRLSSSVRPASPVCRRAGWPARHRVGPRSTAGPGPARRRTGLRPS